jgi:hypothetical protein
LVSAVTDTVMIEKAELQQIMRWLNGIEDAVELIKKDPEETFDVIEGCRRITRTLEKMRGFLTIIGS